MSTAPATSREDVLAPIATAFEELAPDGWGRDFVHRYFRHIPADELTSRTADEYIGGGSGRPAADEARRTRRLVSMHITGTAAIAVVELDYPSAHYIDYMTLLKVGEEWRIINKSFFIAPRAPRAPRAPASASASSSAKP